MIVPDLNLLVYAHNTGAPFHGAAKGWWENLVNGQERVGLPWAVLTGFVRLMTHPRVLTHPVDPSIAVDYASAWLGFPHITPLNPGSNHLAYFLQNLVAAGTGGNLVTDCHIAALAMEYQAELHSNDTDFSRFPGLRWVNPL